jgi:hypothetical protein
MTARRAVAVIVVVGAALLLVHALNSQSAQERYEDKIASCRSFAIEGRDNLMPLCHEELRELQREAAEEGR